MCDVMIAAKVAMGAFQMISSASAAREEAAEERRRQELHYKRTTEEADRAAKFEMEGQARKQREEERAEVDEKTKASKATMQAKAAAQVAAAEAGVSGVSIDHLFDDFDRSLGEFNLSVEQTADAQALQDMADVENIKQKRISRIKNAEPGGVRSPSMLQPLGDFAGTLIGAYGKWRSANTKSPSNNSYGRGRGSGYDYLEV